MAVLVQYRYFRGLLEVFSLATGSSRVLHVHTTTTVEGNQ
jgi:hypothetical protein